MYKALFELSHDRTTFVSRLFTRERPSALTASSSVQELMTAYSTAARRDETVYAKNLEAIRDHLTTTRALPLASPDLEGIARVYRAFYWYGPAINFGATLTLEPLKTSGLSFRELMTPIDAAGNGLTYLSSEIAYGFVRDLELRNLVVPVVGNFSGPKALREVGSFIRSRGGMVGLFYVSNVETYLRRDGTWPIFCGSVRALPLDEWSLFIRPSGPSALPGGIGVVPIASVAQSCSPAVR